MESHVKKKEISSFEKKQLQQIVIPLKQMIHEDDEEEQSCIGENVTCLTGSVCIFLSTQNREQCTRILSPPSHAT
jgi:hypothetical protein